MRSLGLHSRNGGYRGKFPRYLTRMVRHPFSFRLWDSRAGEFVYTFRRRRARGYRSVDPRAVDGTLTCIFGHTYLAAVHSDCG